ncbi:MAG: endo-1,4-beta-xylanase [Lachnospiraceae bacterium]|nr:endo-1,4-beta-xylanase [Lachnospiraceae bacterium]
MDLKTAYEPYFKMGAAISRFNLYTPAHMKLLLSQFNSFTCENEMKPAFFLDKVTNKRDPEKFDLSPALTFENAIPFLDFAKKKGIAMRGHTLVWHNQTPKWFFHDRYNEMRPLADRETMLARMEGYIKTVLEFVRNEYPGVIYAFDVVNEAVEDGGFRKSLWTKTIGNDYVEKAFEFARKYAGDIALFYNDYETSLEWKRDFIIENILKPLIDRKLIDGVGLQSHLLMDHPDPEVYKAALQKYGALGIQIHITELDMHNADPSDESMRALAERYRLFFEMYLEEKKAGRADITSVTFWNLRDEDSWLTGFRGETSYPLLFKGKCEAKDAYYSVLDAAQPGAGDRPFTLEVSEEEMKPAGVKQPKKMFRREYIWKKDEYDYAAAYGFVPNIFAYLHTDGEDHDAMLLVPGGGYCMCVPHEGELPANEFFNRGMNVFVLTYTTDITMSVPLKKQPLQDISRAVRFLRRNADEYQIRNKKLVICGFSAGAHLCASLAVHFDDVKDGDPDLNAYSNRPDGVILSYPVITTGEYTHRDSVRALLGDDVTGEELEYFSLEKQVKENTPPCFIWQTATDGLVPVENSYLFAMALRKKGVPFAHYVFPEGFHGLSIANAEYFSGWSGGDYTMEQVMRAVHAVKDGKGVNVSDKRKQELVDQFFGDHEEFVSEVDESLAGDVGLWSDLAWAWLNRL